MFPLLPAVWMELKSVRSVLPTRLVRLQGSLSKLSSVCLHGVSVLISDEPPPKQRRISSIGGVPVRKSKTNLAPGRRADFSSGTWQLFLHCAESVRRLSLPQVINPDPEGQRNCRSLDYTRARTGCSKRRGSYSEPIVEDGKRLGGPRIRSQSADTHQDCISDPASALHNDRGTRAVSLDGGRASASVRDLVRGDYANSGASKAAEWQVVQTVLEIHPAASTPVPPLEAILAREAAASLKEMNALFALIKTKVYKRFPEDKADKRK